MVLYATSPPMMLKMSQSCPCQRARGVSSALTCRSMLLISCHALPQWASGELTGKILHSVRLKSCDALVPPHTHMQTNPLERDALLVDLGHNDHVVKHKHAALRLLAGRVSSLHVGPAVQLPQLSHITMARVGQPRQWCSRIQTAATAPQTRPPAQ